MSFHGLDFTELQLNFEKIDSNGDGFIDAKEIRNALDTCGFKIPAYKSRLMENEILSSAKIPGKITYPEFETICKSLKSKEVSSTFKSTVTKKENLQHVGKTSEASNEDTTHSIHHEEQLAFTSWINAQLENDPDVKHHLPIEPTGRDLFEKVTDGILLCKLINISARNTIDERAINKTNLTVHTKMENVTLALSSAQAIGCNVMNSDAHDIVLGRKPHIVLGLVWQILRIGLLNQINVKHCPGLSMLLREDEELEEFMALTPEHVLIRWVNYHLEQALVPKRIRNFQGDISDSEAYTHLLRQIAPAEADVNISALNEGDLVKRAEIMLQQADKLECRSFITPQDVVKGVNNLNLVFVANLFNHHPGLKDVSHTVEVDDTLEEREARIYRNWMNSMGVSPFVYRIYSDLTSGLVIFQLYDIIKPGIVNWDKVQRKFINPRTAFLEQLQNCNYAVEIGRELRFSLVGISGDDINKGHVKLTLALVWQLMKAYTLTILSKLAGTGKPITEKEIVEWANAKLSSANKKTSIRGFRDSSIADGRVIIDLVDAIKPGSINYDLLKTGGHGEDNLTNAKYALSVARKAGARVYALPEAIAEVDQKMVMTVFACLMMLDLKKK